MKVLHHGTGSFGHTLRKIMLGDSLFFIQFNLDIVNTQNCISLCVQHNELIYIYHEMIIIINLLNMSSHIGTKENKVFFVMRTFRIYSLNNFHL